jgi:hypothetical protein
VLSMPAVVEAYMGSTEDARGPEPGSRHGHHLITGDRP